MFKNTPKYLLFLTMIMSSCVGRHIGSSSLAFKEIEGTTISQVSEVTKQVFKNEGYTLVEELGSDSFQFERTGNRDDTLRWAHIGSTDLRMRVNVSIEQMPDSQNILVRADAFKIKGSWAPEKLTLVARHPYQKSLETIAMKVNELVKK